MRRGGVVVFEVSAREAYDHLVEPLNRPQWQSSLRAVEVPDAYRRGTAGVGLRWVDVTWPGLRPRMELTVAEPGQRWTEVGHWRGVEADLTLTFSPLPASGTGEWCRVEADFELRLPGLLAPVGGVLTTLAVRPVLGDLRRAARHLR